MLESGLSGSVRGVLSNGHPYRDPGSEMAQHEPVARIEALYRNEWPRSADFVAEVGALRAVGMPLPLASVVSNGLDARVEVRSSTCTGTHATHAAAGGGGRATSLASLRRF
jgi:hypothetical protein